MTLDQLKKSCELLGAYLGEKGAEDYGSIIIMPWPEVQGEEVGHIVLGCTDGEEFPNIHCITCYPDTELIKLSFRTNESGLTGVCLAAERVSAVSLYELAMKAK